jgi:hypothetical protein
MLDRAVAEPSLQRPRIMPRIRQSVTTGMPEHVAVNWEGKAGTLANMLDQPIDSVGRERAAPARSQKRSRCLGIAGAAPGVL